MIIYETYKDRPAVAVECPALRAVFLPLDGAKLVSLVTRDGKERMATAAGERYRVLTADGSYIDAECSSFDDMFPTVDPYTPNEGAGRGIPYPDHGEACRLSYDVSAFGDAVRFSTHSTLFPLVYEKTAEAEEDGILIRYTYRNESDEPFPFLWAGHIMLKGEDGARLLTPFPANTPTESVFDNGDASRERPTDRLTGFAAGLGPTYKFYYLDPLPKGFFGIEYPEGCKLFFTFDEKKLPFLGVWLNNGQFKDSYSITPEPCTVPFDAPDKAKARGYESVIPPRGEFSFSLRISFSDAFSG